MIISKLILSVIFVPTVTSNEVETYRVYNPNSGEHLYTKSAAERDKLVKARWKDEGVAFYSK